MGERMTTVRQYLVFLTGHRISARTQEVRRVHDRLWLSSLVCHSFQSIKTAVTQLDGNVVLGKRYPCSATWCLWWSCAQGAADMSVLAWYFFKLSKSQAEHVLMRHVGGVIHRPNALKGIPMQNAQLDTTALVAWIQKMAFLQNEMNFP